MCESFKWKLTLGGGKHAELCLVHIVWGGWTLRKSEQSGHRFI